MGAEYSQLPTRTVRPLTHRPADPNSLSPGKVTAIYEDSDGVLWVGFFPRALDRLDRKTGKVTHYVPGPEIKNALSRGNELNSIYKDARGYLWLGGWVPVLIGSMNAVDSSSITGTALMIPTA